MIELAKAVLRMDLLVTDEGVENTPIEAERLSAQTITVQESSIEPETTLKTYREIIFNSFFFVIIIASLALLFFLLKKRLDFVTLTCTISGMFFSSICLLLILTRPK